MPRLKVYDLATGTWQYAGGVDPVALATDPAFTTRYSSKPSAGVVYGISQYHGVLAVNTPAPQTTATPMITISMPSASVGSLLIIAMTVYVNSSVGHGSAFLSFRVNGITVGPTLVVTDENALRTYAGTVVNVAQPVGTAYNIDLMASKSNAGGSAVLQGSNSTLSVVSYRS